MSSGYGRSRSRRTRLDTRRRWIARIEALLEAGENVVCTDLRTRKELDAARRFGAKTILITRRDSGASRQLSSHRTETELSGLPVSSFDEVIRNDGTIDGLHDAVLGLAARVDR